MTSPHLWLRVTCAELEARLKFVGADHVDDLERALLYCYRKGWKTKAVLVRTRLNKFKRYHSADAR